MPEPPVPDDADAEDSLGVTDLLQDAVTDLLGVEARLVQFEPSSEPLTAQSGQPV